MSTRANRVKKNLPGDIAERWFSQRGWQVFPFQREVWDAYLRGGSGLIHAATGTGKTYAAWFGPLLEWAAEHADQNTAPPLQLVWITPLRALAGDTAAALQTPLDDLKLPWTLETRTGDSSSATRARQSKRLPSTLITTPESLTLLLSRADAANTFGTLRMVIVDEWHELLSSKRGVLVELALARLRLFNPGLRVWGLSATLGNLDVALHALLGKSTAANPGHIIRGITPKALRVESLLPETIERFPWAVHLGLKLLPQVVNVIETSRSVLLFTNTRSQTEQWYQALLEAHPDWAGNIALHHGSLDRSTREWVEAGLRAGLLRAVVCTSSLDLGVDFSPVDRVLQIGSPKGVARLLQRAGRSGHRPGAESVITCVPTHAFELIEAAAARRAIEAGDIESRPPIDCPLDVLVQHLVTMALGGGFRPDELLREIRGTYAFRNLTDAQWQWALDFVTTGGQSLRVYPEYRKLVSENGRYTVPDKTIARRHRLSIGTIVSDANIWVQYMHGRRLGSVEESFIARLKPGECFLLAGRALELVRVRDMTAWVRRATGKSATVPRWMGSKMPLSTKLAAGVRDLLEQAGEGIYDSPEMQTVKPLLSLQAQWSILPRADELLIERIKSREGHHLYFYPFEGRLVHLGLASLFAWRLGCLQPVTFSMAINDYGFELLSHIAVDIEPVMAQLLSVDNIFDDLIASLNSSELGKRQFREIARIAGLIFQGYPGSGKTQRQLQVSSGLIYEVFERYEPGNLLLHQAQREVLERQLEIGRLRLALERIAQGRITIKTPRYPTPLAFPLLAERFREKLSSEKLADRIRRMQIQLENAADKSSPGKNG